MSIKNVIYMPYHNLERFPMIEKFQFLGIGQVSIFASTSARATTTASKTHINRSRKYSKSQYCHKYLKWDIFNTFIKNQGS
mmetsp:Transcript_14692/g.21874  ORF Transcript_14692/g.21874 Transcript_14692/m.21874 type:complete len:81 (+) Transcript_14692:292-534(+)